jgi:hypothetical protein
MEADMKADIQDGDKGKLVSLMEAMSPSVRALCPVS